MCNAFNDLIALYKLPPPPSIGRRGEAPFGFLTPIVLEIVHLQIGKTHTNILELEEK